MAIDKSNTPVWMKATLIVLAVIFVFGFISIGASPFLAGNGTTAQTPTAGSLDSINQQFQPTVASLTAILQSDPESYTVLVNLGNTYFDWAIQVQQASQTSSATVGADQPLWVSAKDAYRRALALKSDESPVRIDYAITALYTGETSVAVTTAEEVVKADPEFAPAYFNLGVFYNTAGDPVKALASFEKYLKMDPDGKQGNADFAKQEVDRLKGASTTTTP